MNLGRVLITGGAGFIGSHLVEALVARHEFDEIVIYDNLHSGRLENNRPHLDSGAVWFIHGDVRDAEALRSALAHTTTVFHLAAQANVMGAAQQPEYTFATNVTGTFNVLQQAHRCNVQRVIFTSSREVYGEPASLPVSEETPLAAKNDYGASKVAGEVYSRLFHQAGLEVGVVRLTNVYGPRDPGRVISRFIEKALRGESLTIYGGEQVIDFIWVGDVVDILIRLALSEPLPDFPVNVGSGIGTRLTTLAEQVRAITGSHSEIILEPARAPEVIQFVANTQRLQDWLGTKHLRPPLEKLSDVVEDVAARLEMLTVES
jgi:nucleoside-diphosphate-sugar epimerase